MIKKLFIFIIVICILLGILFSTSDFKQLVVVTQNNSEKKPLDIESNKYTDRYCNMKIIDIRYTAQAIMPNNDTFYFDDIGCLVSWLKDQRNKDQIVLWTWARDIDQYIDARKAWYSTDEDTPMEYGFGSYKNKKNNYIDFQTMTLKVYRGETLQNLTIRKKELKVNDG
jgi:hypothetical protein